MTDTLRILRYNTGTDKKAFVQFKDFFDAVIFNATIVAYSGQSVSDLVSMHKRKYIIDPQTHIFQQEFSSITSDNKPTGEMKRSIKKYFNQLPESLTKAYTSKKLPLDRNVITDNVDDLVDHVYTFEIEYVLKYAREKDYDKYLKYAKLASEPRFVIAPYFMLKKEYSNKELEGWLSVNKVCLEKTILLNEGNHKCYPIAAQLVIDKSVLTSENFIEMVCKTYSTRGYEYIFIWVDDFNSFECKKEVLIAFSQLLNALNRLGKKPVMAYGGYESILLCNRGSQYRLFGVAQSVGYGEYRPITPVGGGMPVNKYYFLPIHQRINFDKAAEILADRGFFSDTKTSLEHSADYYKEICDCKKCRSIIDRNIHNFATYNDSTPFTINTKNGAIKRNRPTTDAELNAAFHFLYCKVSEWSEISQDYRTLINKLAASYALYMPSKLKKIEEWCSIYGCKEE